VISGLGVVSPFGASTSALAQGLMSGRTAVAPVTAFDVEGCRAKCSAAVTRFDATEWISPMKLRRYDTTSQYALAIARQALDAAGLPYGETPDDSIGVVLGTYTAGGGPTEDFLQGLFTNGPLGVPVLIFNATVGNIAASVVGLELKLRGPNVTVSQKEISGVLALGHAADLLRGGHARALVAGAVDALYPMFYRVHDRFHALAYDNGRPEGSRPFDESRNGFVLGEGGFAMTLELEDAATERGAAVLAHVLAVEGGSATTGLNQWPASPGPIARVMRCALDVAGIRADEIDVVYASANSSKGLDEVEADALTDVFGGCRARVTSVKGAIGESSAAGAAAVVAAIVCGREGVVPPIAGLENGLAASRGLRLVRDRERAGPLALINSVASGGALAAAVIRVVAAA
jgi:3-oxoacyl-[acyl-carrier-protein] synthase II